ncbi:MAG TPA: ABC transporter permease [Geminicoccaceae bacterium]|nr:ABC transporter permease [Geminicoccaceae bacterium]
MAAFIVRRLGLLVLTLFGISLLVFGILQLLPGDAATAILGAWRERSGQTHEYLRHALGIDRVWYEQYFSWLWGVLHGDLGRSLSMDAPITPILFERLGYSLRLAIPALLLAVSISLVLGVVAATRPNGFVDHAITVLTLAGVSVPAFVTGAVLILIFAAWLGWFPSSSSLATGAGFLFWAKMLALPVATLTVEALAHITRITRSSMIEVLKTPYVRTARLKGMPLRTVLFKHALRNAMLPTVTVIAFNIGWMLGGVVVVEQVFSYPGLGSLVLYAIEQRDIPLLQASMFFVAAGYCVANLLADITYALLDPRIRY